MVNMIYGNVGVDLLYYENKEEKAMYYSPMLTFFFNEDGDEYVTIPTDIHTKDKMEALQICFKSLGNMFESIAAVVNIIDAKTTEVIEVINMNKVDQEEEVETFSVTPEDKPVYLH
jgi:hypothetical protein